MTLMSIFGSLGRDESANLGLLLGYQKLCEGALKGGIYRRLALPERLLPPMLFTVGPALG